ncbi:helix-turn-helix domain-containing protein [Natranaerofaba carboxydovora]|uniref:helix-turn-helix domain-containing protein n=1 Tax=Natranaerofaba carboxydovora TaxID=2742683 RepID=UPI001F132011|nr:helix-turn-helix domain-containing protein [Natranaerofaba carboxydovora]UMZ72553.1 putative HTH-type transcriptional regulator [Natranaerofaba carboxydovora]
MKKNMGKRIRMERERLKMNRKKFSEHTGLSEYYIGQIERGERKMSIDSLLNISNCLHLSADYILKGKERTEEKKHENEIYQLLNRCEDKDLELIKDLVKLILPYLKN